jgi:hypothetical protein
MVQFIVSEKVIEWESDPDAAVTVPVYARG